MTEIAANAWAQLHDEGYDAPFATREIPSDSAFLPGGRPSTSLSGPWLFCIDPFDEGLRQRWFETCFAPLSAQKAPYDYHIDGSERVELPASLGAVRPDLLHYDGPAWFGRWIDPPAIGANQRLFLRVGAAAGRCDVFANGAHVGRHRGGSTPFCVELPRKDGPIFLHLRVDHRRRSDAVPMHHVDWHDYGGVFRAIDLFVLPRAFLRSWTIGLDQDGAITCDLELSDPITTDVRIGIAELGIDAVVAIEAGRGSARFPGEPERWSPARPTLYRVELAFAGERLVDRIGFRTIESRDRRIYLNGEPVFLRGVCVHEDDAQCGRVTDEADLRRRFARARELGCNFLRLAHYPHHERAAEIADELGFLLWEEIPVYWAIDFASEATRAEALGQLEELIRRDRNRASVVIWGIGNENADTDARLDFMRALAKKARALDPNRLVGAACMVDKKKKRMSDRLAAALDIVGVNEYYGWYDPDIADLLEIDARYEGDAPIVITETGADAVAGLRGEADCWFTEEHQAAYFERQFEALERLRAVRGFCPWLLYDFRAHRRQNRHQRGFNRKGLIAADKKTKKLAFDVVARAYAARRTKAD